jgi:hypothetical protein
MIKRYKQSILYWIEKEELSPSEFTFVPKGIKTLITHKQTNLSFQFIEEPMTTDSFAIAYSTFLVPDQLLPGPKDYLPFHLTVPWFQGWLTREVALAIEELSMPDPFLQFSSDIHSTTIGNISAQETSSFTPAEKTAYKESIDKFHKELLNHFEIDNDLKEKVVSEMKYLKESVDRLNKRDWQAVAMKIFYDIGVGITANLILSGVTGAVTTISPKIIELAQRIFAIAPTTLH